MIPDSADVAGDAPRIELPGVSDLVGRPPLGNADGAGTLVVMLLQ